MPNNPLCVNSETGHRLSYKQVRKGVEICAFEWVEPYSTFRKLTPSESFAARIMQTKYEEPLPAIEIPGLVFEPSNLAQTRRGFALVREAQEFCEANA